MNIDELFDMAKDAVNKAAQKTNDVVAYSKLKVDAVRVNDEICKLYEKLGHAIYDMRKNGYHNDEMVASVCEEIRQLELKLEQLNQEIAEKKNLVVCPVCGAQNDRESCYCGKCGSRLYETCDSNHFDPREEAEETQTSEPQPENTDSAETSEEEPKE
ncbi:MAG: hypothetical protein ACOX60_04670 [Massiliimalia sp.]|jgi:hypothetical protein